MCIYNLRKLFSSKGRCHKLAEGEGGLSKKWEGGFNQNEKKWGEGERNSTKGAFGSFPKC